MLTMWLFKQYRQGSTTTLPQGFILMSVRFFTILERVKSAAPGGSDKAKLVAQLAAGLETPHQQASADSDERAIEPSDNSSLTGRERSINQNECGADTFFSCMSPILPPPSILSSSALNRRD